MGAGCPGGTGSSMCCSSADPTCTGIARLLSSVRNIVSSTVEVEGRT